MHGLNAGAMVFALAGSGLVALLALFGGGWACIGRALLVAALGCCNGALARVIRKEALRQDIW